jgi:NAD(P)-dependent dehydrogenase (short-subunit alcohol dehydrogenase family)
MAWTRDDIPVLRGRTALVTGANSGLGFEIAAALARRGADVLLACRDPEKGARAIDAIRSDLPGAALELVALDLADLASVRGAAAAFSAKRRALHLLVNNAGVMALPEGRTADGFERQLGTNHLGHFALTGLLLDPLLRGNGARVVVVSSLMHRFGRMRFDDLNGERRRYRRWGAYCDSKLANLLFAFELARRLGAAGLPIVSAAAHPGYTSTELVFGGARLEGSRWKAGIMRLGNRLIGQKASVGALPALYAATSPDVENGGYFGPSGPLELAGAPKKVHAAARALCAEDAARLWEASAELTGVRYLEEG